MDADATALPPLHGAILIGGISSRMGTPKHLLRSHGRTWLECTVAVVAPNVDRLVLVGKGDIPPEQQHLARLDDASGVPGPLAGVLAALSSDTRAAWLVVACDLPRLTAAALHWLIEQRTPGCRGVIPIMPDGRAQPLLAIYEAAAMEAIRDNSRNDRVAPRELVQAGGFLTPSPPTEHAGAWTNVNTPEEFAAFQASIEGG